ncbi:MAG: arsenate reductase ArsC [Burkholderiales bacterium]
MRPTSKNVLFLCTANSARSLMAEGLMSVKSKGRYIGYSAGSHPSGRVNPYAVEMLKIISYPTENLRSKSWDEFAGPNAPHMDLIITVCANAAGEVCPVWPGHPSTAHWGFDDPATEQGSDEHKRAAFNKIFLQIEKRIDNFLGLPLDQLSDADLKGELQKIGEAPA